MKVISQKRGSMRDRNDAEAILVPFPSWRITDEGRRLVLYSQWSATERSVELWLTEQEALGIAKMVSESTLKDAMNAAAANGTKKE